MLLRGVKLLLTALAIVGVVALIALGIASQDNSSSTVSAAIVIGFLAICVLLVAWWAALLWAKRGREAAMVLQHLEQAVRLNLPLPRMVRAIGGTTHPALTKRMDAVAVDLEGGTPLATALVRVPRIPHRVLDLIMAAEVVGRLPQVLERLMQHRRESIERRLRWIPLYRLYPLVLGVVFIVVSTMYFVFVVPKFEQLFHDFKTELPGITRAFLEVGRFCTPGIVLLLLIVLALLIAQTLFGWWRGARLGFAESIGHRVVNYLPVIGAARRYRALADAFDYCADALDAGRPFDTSLDEASRLVANRPIATKLRRWAIAASSGVPILDAARLARMPRFVSSLLGTALYTNGFVAVLRFLARYYRNRFIRAVALIEACAAPAIAIGMGILVLWLALAVLAPLISLVQSLSSAAPGWHL
jgi:type IV pilus assembly protein PilC